MGPGDAKTRAALLSAGETEIELLEPLTPDSPISRYLAKRGEGLHHIGVIVPSLVEATAAMQTLGCPVIQSGSRFGAAGDGEFAYYDASTSLGMIVEAVVPPASGLGDPDSLFP